MSDFFGGLSAGNYTVYIQDVNGCESAVPTLVEEPFELDIDLGVDVTVELGASVQLFAQVNTSEPLTYSWTPATGLSCSDCPNPVMTGTESTIYEVTITNEAGCTATDDIFVEVDNDRDVFIPNIFSPDNDGTNDVFFVNGGIGVEQVDIFRVYDLSLIHI